MCTTNQQSVLSTRCDLYNTRVVAPACMHSLDRNAWVRTEISLVEIHTSLPYYNLGVTRESPN
eukprot:COSAG02_NODE_1275_length_13506_cov_8.845603_14_plen_63_part_00